MLDKIAAQGFADACATFKVAGRRVVSARPGVSMPSKPKAPVPDAVQSAATRAANAGVGGLGHVQNFLGDQWEHAKTFGGGLKSYLGSFGGTEGTAAGRKMQRTIGAGAMGDSLRGLTPSLAGLGGLAALGAGAYALSGDSAEEKMRKAMMAQRGMY